MKHQKNSALLGHGVLTCGVLITLLAATYTVAQSSPDPRREGIPDWAKQGNFHFTRLDGDPIEPLKTARSAWGKHFTDPEKEVLGNLYGKYGDRAIDLMSQAGVDWVWLTWSVGFSWQDEEEQRRQAKVMVDKLHGRGFHVTAYTCASSIFWESMFRDEPRSTAWIKFDSEGAPFRYSEGRYVARFIADISKPEWLAFQKRRIGAAVRTSAWWISHQGRSILLRCRRADQEGFLYSGRIRSTVRELFRRFPISVPGNRTVGARGLASDK